MNNKPINLIEKLFNWTIKPAAMLYFLGFCFLTSLVLPVIFFEEHSFFLKLNPKVLGGIILLDCILYNFVFIWLIFLNNFVKNNYFFGGIAKKRFLAFQIIVYVGCTIVFYAVLYLFLYFLNRNSFNNPSNVLLRIEDFIYFSAVTFATVGYGDIIPKTTFARCVVTLEILNSLFILAFVITNLDFVQRILSKDLQKK